MWSRSGFLGSLGGFLVRRHCVRRHCVRQHCVRQHCVRWHSSAGGWLNRLLLVGLVLTSVLAFEAGLALSPAGADWIVPVQAPVVDPFRPPSTRYGSGNRGLEYGNSEGLEVVAVDSGRVVFAGTVGRALHVVVDHGSGLRSTYAYLQSSAVVRGQSVRKGQVVGRAASGFHLTARLGDVYVDPALLFAGAEVVLQLTESPPPTVRSESALSTVRSESVLSTVRSEPVLPSGGRSPWDGILTTLDSINSLQPANVIQRTAASATVWYRQDCTEVGGPAGEGDVAMFAEAGADRVLIQVGGLGSQDGEASIGTLDAEALGYSADDIAGFSYAGGCTPEPFGLGPAAPDSLTLDLRSGASGSGSSPYGPPDTHQSVEVSATRLADLVEATALSRPGQAIDIAAHSLGGVVTRRALEILDQRRQDGTLTAGAMPSVVITIGSPHRGAPLADGAIIVSDPFAGSALPAVSPDWLDSESVGEVSLNGPDRLDPPSHPPDGVRVVAIAGDSDKIVPSTSAIWPDATNALVFSRHGMSSTHSELPAHPDVAIELGLALRGQAARCISLIGSLLGSVSGTAVTLSEQGVNAVIGVGRWLL